MPNEIVIQTNPAPLATHQQLDNNPAAVYLASLARSSRRTMQYALDKIADLLGFDDWQAVPWAGLRYQHTNALRAALAEQYAPSTANRMLSALRGTLKAAYRLGQLSQEQYQHATDVGTVKGEGASAAAGRALTLGELSALLDTCARDGTAKGARDVALFAVARLGLRRAEIAALSVSSYDRAAGTLTVTGKGNKTRVLPVEGAIQEAIEDWLAVRGATPGPLFWRVHRSGSLQEEGLTSQGVYHIMQQRAEEAGVSSFTPHDLRRTFAGDLLDAGADIVTVQKLMGHSNPQTTARYDRRGERAKRDAIRGLHLPYRKRSR